MGQNVSLNCLNSSNAKLDQLKIYALKWFLSVSKYHMVIVKGKWNYSIPTYYNSSDWPFIRSRIFKIQKSWFHLIVCWIMTLDYQLLPLCIFKKYANSIFAGIMLLSIFNHQKTGVKYWFQERWQNYVYIPVFCSKLSHSFHHLVYLTTNL